MLYFAQVVRKHGKSKLLLAARQRIDRVWVALSLPEILLDLPSSYDYGEGVLVLVEIVEVDNKQQITKLTPAFREIVRLLQDYSSRVAKLETQIKDWKESIDTQAEEFYLRQQKYNRWMDTVKKNPQLLKLWEDLVREEQEEVKDIF
jgi:t-SNARE complex subunit (syntaxin)